MTVSVRLVTERLRDYQRHKQRLADEAALIQAYLSQSAEEPISLYRSPGFDAPMTHSGISDPTSHVAFRLIAAREHQLPSRIQSFVRMHDDEQRLMIALDACLKRLSPRERSLVCLTYFAHVSPKHVALQAHLSLSAMYRERECAVERLTTLIRTRLSNPIPQAS